MQQYCVVGEVSSASRTDNYAVLSTLGRGTYGVCYKVQHKGSGEVRVMKAVSLQGLSAKDVEDTLNEARLMHRLRHQNIIQHIDSWCESQWLFIIMEYAEQGDLGAVVAAGGATVPRVPESDVLRYIADIAQGLKYLHDNYVLHRDIKPSNIFLVGGKAVIADLGLGRLLSSPSALAYSKVGTPLYFSPELCEEKPYDEKSDVWAFGCLIYELATGKPPFTAANQVALSRKVVHDAPPPLPPHFSAELGILVHSMLQKNPAHRVSVADILEFPIVRRWVEQLASERAAPGRHAAPDSGVTAEKLEAEYQERRQLLEEAYQAKLLAMEEMFQQRVEEAEAAALLVRAEQEEQQRQALEEAEKQITTLQERNAALQEEIDGSVAEVHMLRDSEAQGLRVRSQLDEALQQLTAKLVNKEADCFRAAEEADSNRKRAEGLQVELEKSRKEALEAEEQLRAQLKEREAEVEGLQFALEQSRSDVETKQKMLTDYEHLFSMLQEETHGASSLPRSQTCSEGGVEQNSALPLTTDNVLEATDQDEAAVYHSSKLLELSSQSEPSRQIGKSSPRDEFSLGAKKSTSCPVSVVDTKEPVVASESHVVDETDCRVGPSLLESLLADADVMQYYSRQEEAEGDSRQSTHNCLGEYFVGWECTETSCPDPRHTEDCCFPPASTLEQECGLKQMVSNTEADPATMESHHRSEAPSDGAAAELEDEYLMASPTSSFRSASPFVSSTDRKATHECARDGTREVEGHEESSFGNRESASSRSSSSDASSNKRISECSFEGESKSRCSRDNSENDQESGEAVAEKTGCLPSVSVSMQDCSYDELLIDGEPTTPLAGSAKPEVRQTAGGSESGDSVEAVLEVTVHCESARAIFSSQEWREKQDNGKQWQRPLTPQIESRNLRAVGATEAAEHHVSPRPMSAALGAIASAKARENEGLDDSDSEQTSKQGKAEMTPAKGIIRTRCVSLDQLGVTPTSSHKSASPSCHRATTFPVLLAWRKQPGANKGRVSEPSPLRIANTVQQLAWGNKERYSLSAGGESSLAILFRPAGARTPSIRKILARRGCNAEFVRLDTAPTQCLQSQFGWRLVQAVLPHTVPAAARLVRAGNPTGELVEIIVEFGNPNATDELLVLRSDARLRELLSSAASSGQKAAHSSTSPVGGGGVSAHADRVEPTASLHCVGASVGASLSRRGRASPQTRQQVRRPMSAASVPSTSQSNRVQQALPRRASSPSPRAHNSKEAPTDAPRCSRTADDVVCEVEPRRKQWPLSSAQVALLLDRVSRVAKEQESSRRAEGAGREEAVGPAVDTRTEVADVEGGETCVSNVCERPEQVMKTGSAESSPECTPKRVGAAEATVELLRHLDYVGQVAAVSQKLIELVTTPATSPQKGDDGKQVPSKATQQPRGRSPLSPTSRGNVANSSASRGTRSFRRQGRSSTASTDGLRTSSDALCMEAVHLQDRLRAAMHCLGSNSQSPRLEGGKVASSSTVSRRGRSPSFNRGKSSTRAKS